MVKSIAFRLALSIVIALFLLGLASASSYKIELYQVDQKVLVKEFISFDSQSSVNITLPSDAKGISVNVNYTLSNGFLTASGKDLQISYLTESLIDVSKDNYYLAYKLPFRLNNAKIELTIFLKEGFIVNPEEIFPQSGKIETDGRRISIKWSFDALEEGKDIPIFVKIQNLALSSSIYSLVIILAEIIAGIIFMVIIIRILTNFLKNRRTKSTIKKQKKKAKPSYLEYLMESEKKVIEELKKSEKGEMWQKQLQLSTGFSKAKLSRVVRNLESRNLVEKIPFGNTNKIKLKK